MIHDTRSPDCLHERELVRRTLLAARPGLRSRMTVGPTGALTIPVRAGRAIEIGRMRRLGRSRWVVVEPMEEGARVHEPVSLEDCARIALAALARWRGIRPVTRC